MLTPASSCLHPLAVDEAMLKQRSFKGSKKRAECKAAFR